MSLRTRVSLAVAALTGLALLMGGAFARENAQSELITGIDAFLIERSANFSGPGAPTVNEHMALVGSIPDDERPLFAQSDAHTVLVAPDGTRLAAPGTPELPLLDTTKPDGSSSAEPVFARVSVSGTEYRMIATPIPGGGYALIGRDLTEADAVVAGLTNRLAVAGGVGLCLVTFAAWLIVRRSLAPVEQVASAAEQIAASMDLGDPITISRNDEVGRLATSFNTMTAALADSRNRQRELVQNAGHELRTPLASLKTGLEVLGHFEELSPERRERLLANADRELDSLATLVNELVELAHNPTETHEPTHTRLADIAGAVATTASDRFGRSITVASTRPFEVPCVGSLVERAVANLVDNAVKFSPAGGPIEITVTHNTIEVVDSGDGIEERDLPRIFDRFYRSDQARGLPGSGLGLSIVADVARQHGGHVWASNRPEGGARIGFSIGRDQPAAAAFT